MKLTHQRLEIVSEVARPGEHPDAETVFRGVRERLPTVSLDTGYRTRWLLIDLGVLTTLGPPRERGRFAANMRAHPPCGCTPCGRARDFSSPTFDAVPVPAAVTAWGRLERTLVEIRGRCARCVKEQKGK